MDPTKLADQLRRIASQIDNSKSPSKDLVRVALIRVLAAIDETAAKKEIPPDDDDRSPDAFLKREKMKKPGELKDREKGGAGAGY